MATEKAQRTTSSTRTRKQEQAIATLIECRTIEQAAARCGLAVNTLRNWLADNDFQKTYKDARKAHLQSAIEFTNAAAGRATEALLRVIEHPESSDAAIVSAARGVWDVISKNRDFSEIEERLQELEETMAANTAPDSELPPHLHRRR